MIEYFIPSFAYPKDEFWKQCTKAIRRNDNLNQACVTLKVHIKDLQQPAVIHLLEHIILTGKNEFELEQKGLFLQAYTEPNGITIQIQGEEHSVPKALHFLNQLNTPNFLSNLNQKELDSQKKVILLEDKTLKVWQQYKESHKQLNQVNGVTLVQIREIYKKYWNNENFFLAIDYPNYKKKEIPSLKEPHLFGLAEGKGASLYRIFRLQLECCYACGSKPNEIFIYSNRIFTESYLKETLLKDISQWNSSHLERIRNLAPLEIKGIQKTIGKMPNWTLNKLKTAATQWVSKARLEVTPEKEGLFYISLKNHIEDKDLP